MKSVINIRKKSLLTMIVHRQQISVRSSFFLFTILFLLTLNACMREDFTDCPDETTLTLYFEYLNTEQEDCLKDYIQQVDVILFDSDTLFYKHLKINTRVEGVAEITIPVLADNYFVLAWGNLEEEGILSNALDNRHFGSYQYTHRQASTQGDLLYYAPAKQTRSSDFEPYQVEVKEGENKTHTLSFMPAGHTIRIYIKGLDHTVLPEAFIQNSPGGYDFHLNPLFGQTVSYRQECLLGEIEEETIQGVSFHVPHFDNENELIAGIEYSDLNIYEEVVLEEYMVKHGLSVYDGGACEISIMFIYEEGVLVQVALPGWEDNPIGGGF